MSLTPTEPAAARPHMPNYGISTQPEGMLTWGSVEEQLTKARNYWICSTRTDGRPHASPVWGVWMDGAVYFGCDRQSRKARNFAENSAVVVHLESGDEAVIIEGQVEEVKDRGILRRMAELYGAKYPPYKPDPDAELLGLYYVVKPRVAFAWQERDFLKTATRWVFDAE
jgi:pyridoxine/pyridoxamine 5'-phosphate oxidase